MNDEIEIIEAELVEQGQNLPEVRNASDLEFEYARANIVEIIETSKKVLKNTAMLAIESDHPRMIEVYTALIKGLSDINKDLFDIRERKMRIKGELEPVTVNQINNNTYNNTTAFVGSTEELLTSLKRIKEV